MTAYEPRSQEQALDLSLIHTITAHRDERALNALYLRYSDFIRRVVSSVLKDDWETDEVIQDVFRHLWDEGRRYDPERGQLSTWLAVLSQRRAIDRMRQRCTYQRARQRFEINEKARTRDVFIRSEPVEVASSNDLRRYLHVLLNELPPRQREVVLLAYYDGMSQRRIASRLNLPLGTVRTRIELGMRKLSVAVARVRRETS